jgi:predicted dehydrogenase
MTAPVSLAVVGFGRWGKVLVDSVQGKSDKVRFVAAVGRDPARIAADAEARGMRAFATLEAMLADPAVDGVVIASPHSQHAVQIEAVAVAGKPVMVEKPFTLTRASAEDALRTARESGILVAAAHNRRFLPPVAELKAMIDAGELGTVLHIETNFSGNSVGRYSKDAWRIAPGESPAGGLAGSGIHHIDTIIFLQGAIEDVYAITRRRIHDVPLDDTTMVSFRMKAGSTASLLTMTATVATYSIQVFGTKAKVEINGLAEKRGSETMTISRTDGTRSERTYAPFDIERAELEAFAAAISGEERYPIDPDEILNGVAAFEAVSLSAEKRMPITL